MIKKFIAFISAAALLMSAVPVLAAEIKNIEPDAPYREALETIAALGIMDTDGIRPREAMTRGELVHYAVLISGMSGENTDTGFYDVGVDHPYAGDIAVARRIGMVEGDGKGFFEPDAPAEYQTAAKILLSVIGYQKLIEHEENPMEEYLRYANRTGLSDGVELAADSAVSFGDGAQLIYNTLMTPVLLQSYSDSTSSFYTNEDITVLSQNFNIYCTTGRVTANRRTSLDGRNTSEPDEIEVEFEKYLLQDTFDDGLLGHRIKAYYKKDGSLRRLVYAADQEENEVTVIQAEDIVSCNNGRLTYFVGNREKSVEIPKSVYTVYNDEAYPDWDEADFEIERGSITLLDNNGGGTDVVFVNTFDSYMVSAIKTDTKEVYLENGGTLNLDEDKASIMIKDGISGAELTFADLKRDTMICVSKSKGGKTITVYSNNPYVQGVVEKAGSDEVVIGGKTYGVYPDFDAVRYLGRDVKLWIDIDGKAAILDKNEKRQNNVGFILAGAKTDGFAGKTTLKMLTSSGAIELYDVSDKVTVDGSRKNGQSEITPANILDVLKACSSAAGRESIVSQLVYYDINEDNLITKIDTMRYLPEDEAEDSLKGSETIKKALYCRSGRVLLDISSNRTVCNITNDAVVFVVPDKEDERAADDDAVSVKNGAFFQADVYYPDSGMINYTGLEYYNANDVGTSNVIVLYSNSDTTVSDEISGNYRDKIMAVSDVITVLDDNGSAIYALEGYHGGAAVQYKLTESLNNHYPDFDKVFHSGDVVAVELLGERIKNIKRLFSREENAPYFTERYVDRNASFYGKVYSCDETYIMINFGSDSSPDLNSFWLPASGLTLLAYDSEHSRYRIITPDEIVGSLDTGGAGNDIYVYTNYGRPYLIVMYEK